MPPPLPIKGLNGFTGVGGDGDDGVDAGRKFGKPEVVHRPRRDERLRYISQQLRYDEEFSRQNYASANHQLTSRSPIAFFHPWILILHILSLAKARIIRK